MLPFHQPWIFWDICSERHRNSPESAEPSTGRHRLLTQALDLMGDLGSGTRNLDDLHGPLKRVEQLFTSD
jgi:hypothetical protein